MFCDKHRCVIR
nr:unnamed protein product [Callosobruchus analis]